ncbi:hypothetical protein GCM10010363_58280 [Streptomyces omiyaensis]|nr:hypothetical protein GCM10010363_58280 [Streptomyces omiyaensis]
MTAGRDVEPSGAAGQGDRDDDAGGGLLRGEREGELLRGHLVLLGSEGGDGVRGACPYDVYTLPSGFTP